MYIDYWQLDRMPFEPTSDQRNYYPSETHQGALLKLRYAVENRRGAALLAGPSGCGKTMLVQALRRQIAEDFAPFVHMVFPQMSPHELLTYLADALGAPLAPMSQPGVDATVRRIETFLAENTRQGRHAVVAIDEAQFLTENDCLETIRLLLNFELAGRPGLMLLLVGQSAMLPALARLSTLDDRIAVKTVVRPLTLEETAGYVQHRLDEAGAGRTIFEMSALEAVHAATRGIPRQINRLADLALLVGYAEQRGSISAEQIESVAEELVAVAVD